MEISILSHLVTLGRTALGLVYPPSCVGCGRPHGGTDPFFCPRCELMVAWRDPIRCPICEQPTTRPGAYCAGCQSHWPPASRIVTLGYYAGPLRRAMRIFKYGHVEPVGARLGDALALRLTAEVGGIDRVVPVPGGRQRLRERGFDPTTVIARPIARRLGVPLDDGVIERCRDGESLAGRTRLDREVQVHGRYACRREGALAGRRVLVVDDVYTTGVSLGEVARLVREEGGASSVVGAVVARTVVEPDTV